MRQITNNREEFILFGRCVAEVLREENPDKQWTISLEGEGNSGKSLLALAANHFINPHLYPLGITRDAKVDLLAGEKQTGHYRLQDKRVYFSDGLWKIDFRKKRKEYHPQWKEEMERNKDIKLFYVANVWKWTILRTQKNKDDDSKGIFVDVRLNVSCADDEGTPDGFVRLIHMTIADKKLEKKILARYQELLPPKPNTPDPTQTRARPRDHDT